MGLGPAISAWFAAAFPKLSALEIDAQAESTSLSTACSEPPTYGTATPCSEPLIGEHRGAGEQSAARPSAADGSASNRLSSSRSSIRRLGVSGPRPSGALGLAMAVVYPASLGLDEGLADLLIKGWAGMLSQPDPSHPVLYISIVAWCLSAFASALWWMRKVFARCALMGSDGR